MDTKEEMCKNKRGKVWIDKKRIIDTQVVKCGHTRPEVWTHKW